MNETGHAARATMVTVYTAESRLRHPRLLWREMRRDLLASRELAFRLFVRNFRARYRQSVLGYVWVFLPPAAGTLLFLFLRQAGIFSVADTGVPYGAFLVCGFVLWQTFTDAVQSPLRMVSQSRAMLTRVNFPREALILGGLAEVLVTFMVRALLLVAVLAWYRIVPATDAWFFLPAVLVLVGTGIAIGLALVPVGMLYQDVENGLALALPFWMLLTPVLYPAQGAGPGALLMNLNPVAPVLDTARAWLLGGAAVHAQGFYIVGACAGVLLLAGWFAYRLALPILIERMSA